MIQCSWWGHHPKYKWETKKECGLSRTEDNEEKTQTVQFGACASLLPLGIHIDFSLNWKEHINVLSKRLEGAFILSNKSSRLQIGRLYWSPISDLGVLQDQSQQKYSFCRKRKVRITFSLHYTKSCKDVFKSEHLLTVPSIYIHSGSVEMYSCLWKTAHFTTEIQRVKMQLVYRFVESQEHTIKLNIEESECTII